MFFHKPKKPKKAEKVAAYVVDTALYLTERAIRWVNQFIFRWIVQHFAQNGNLQRVTPRNRRVIRILCTSGNIFLLFTTIHILIGSAFGFLMISISGICYFGAVYKLR